MFNIRCAFRHLELLTRCDPCSGQISKIRLCYGLACYIIGPNFTRESDAQNAGNGVSEVQISKIFRGGMPPDPPNYVTYSRMIRSDFSLDPPLGCHDMIKITRDEFSGTTTGRHYGSTWVIRFVDFGKKVHDRCARCDGNEVFGGVRKVTIGDKSVDGVGDGGLMSGCQIPVNPTIKSSVT